MHHNKVNFLLLSHISLNVLDNLIEETIFPQFLFNNYILMLFYHFIIHIEYYQI